MISHLKFINADEKFKKSLDFTETMTWSYFSNLMFPVTKYGRG